MPREWVPKQAAGTVQSTEDAKPSLISEIRHPRQLRRGELGFVGKNVHLGVGNGVWLDLTGTKSSTSDSKGPSSSSPLYLQTVNGQAHATLDNLDCASSGHTGFMAAFTVPGNDTEILYNDDGDFGAVPKMKYNAAKNAIIITAGTKVIING
jgi:hypothetical protein